MIIDGKKIAAELILDLKSKIAAVADKKFLGAVLVGEDPASLNFLAQKKKVAEELGVEFKLYQLGAELTTDDLRQEIGRLAAPKSCGGLIVQLPLPEKINRHYVLNAIPREKDPDVLSESALGAFYSGRSEIVPPSVGVVAEILNREAKDLRKLSAVVIGAGFLIGKPVGFWLQNRVAELTVFDKHAPHLREKLKDADVVISGAGVANLFSAEDLKPGALVIDFGFNPSTSSGQVKKVVGDFNSTLHASSSTIQEISYTPTPGGTGPILVAKLFENFYTLNS